MSNEGRTSVSRRGYLKSVGAFGVLPVPSSESVTRNEHDELRSGSRVKISAVYIPFLADKWDECISHQPEFGEYSIDDSEIINKQIELMKQYGIDTVLFNFGEGPETFNRYRKFLNAENASEINLEVYWAINRVFQRDLDIDRYLDFISNEVYDHPNHNTIDGRPVVQFWASNYIPWHDETRTEIKEEYGGLEGFVSYLRDNLTLGDKDPYLVGCVNDVPEGGLPDNQAVFNRQFDAVSTWFARFQDGETDWDWYLEQTEEDFKLMNQFAMENGMDFIPTVFPGFDDRNNSCWGKDRYLPRDPTRFREVMELANKYRTRDWLNLATFNGWPEGHQVEPGTFNDSEYDSRYLKVIEEFHQSLPSPTATSTQTPTQTPSPTSTQIQTTGTTSPTEKPGTDTTTETRASGPGFTTFSTLAGIMGAAYLIATANSDEP